MHSLLREAVALLTAAWGTRALAPDDVTAAMACVELPPAAVAAARRLRRALQHQQQQWQQEQQQAGGQGSAAAGAGGGGDGGGGGGGGDGGGGGGGGGEENAQEEGEDAAATAPCSLDANYIQDALHFQHRVEAPIKLLGSPSAPRLYVRISAHVYNAKADYERLAAAVLAIAREGGGSGDAAGAAAGG